MIIKSVAVSTYSNKYVLFKDGLQKAFDTLFEAIEYGILGQNIFRYKWEGRMLGTNKKATEETPSLEELICMAYEYPEDFRILSANPPITEEQMNLINKIVEDRIKGKSPIISVVDDFDPSYIVFLNGKRTYFMKLYDAIEFAYIDILNKKLPASYVVEMKWYDDEENQLYCFPSFKRLIEIAYNAPIGFRLLEAHPELTKEQQEFLEKVLEYATNEFIMSALE